MPSRKTIFSLFRFQSELPRMVFILLVSLSFLATEIAKVHHLVSSDNIVLIDIELEGKESSDAEGEHDKSEEKNKKEPKLSPNSLNLHYSSRLLSHNHHFLIHQPDAHQEIPQPPPEV